MVLFNNKNTQANQRLNQTPDRSGLESQAQSRQAAIIMIYFAKVKQVLQSDIHKIGTIENGELKTVSSMPQAARVEIELEGSESDSCIMNRLTKNDEFCGDTWHENFADALSQASFEYGLERGDFKILEQ